MQNEQCGICWNLKFDKKGNDTHGSLHPHEFTPFDYCTECRQPKYDHHGFQTHLSTHNFMWAHKGSSPHKFVSALESEIKNKRRKQLIVLALGGISTIIAATVNLINSI